MINKYKQLHDLQRETANECRKYLSPQLGENYHYSTEALYSEQRQNFNPLYTPLDIIENIVLHELAHFYD